MGVAALPATPIIDNYLCAHQRRKKGLARETSLLAARCSCSGLAGQISMWHVFHLIKKQTYSKDWMR